MNTFETTNITNFIKACNSGNDNLVEFLLNDEITQNDILKFLDDDIVLLDLIEKLSDNFINSNYKPTEYGSVEIMVQLLRKTNLMCLLKYNEHMNILNKNAIGKNRCNDMIKLATLIKANEIFKKNFYELCINRKWRKLANLLDSRYSISVDAKRSLKEHTLTVEIPSESIQIAFDIACYNNHDGISTVLLQRYENKLQFKEFLFTRACKKGYINIIRILERLFSFNNNEEKHLIDNESLSAYIALNLSNNISTARHLLENYNVQYVHKYELLFKDNFARILNNLECNSENSANYEDELYIIKRLRELELFEITGKQIKTIESLLATASSSPTESATADEGLAESATHNCNVDGFKYDHDINDSNLISEFKIIQNDEINHNESYNDGKLEGIIDILTDKIKKLDDEKNNYIEKANNMAKTLESKEKELIDLKKSTKGNEKHIEQLIDDLIEKTDEVIELKEERDALKEKINKVTSIIEGL